jgi:flagellar hook-associated protein 2
MAIQSTTQSALDVPALVTQLMAAERRPIEQLETQVSSYNAKISSWATLSSLVSSVQSAAETLNNSLDKMAATASTEGVVSASAAPEAVPGSYALSVDQLAQGQTLVAAGRSSSTDAIGDGSATTLTFEFGTIDGGTLSGGHYSDAGFTGGDGDPVSITIDGSNNSLEGIRDAINAAAMGISATLVNDGSATPYRLVLTSTETGAAQSMRISASGGDGSIDALLGYDPGGVQNLTQTQAAQNAELKINGIAVTSASNTVNEAIQGVTLNLKNTTTTATTLSVARDTSAITNAASGFVDAYNALANQMKSRSAYATSSSAAGTLAGDGTISALQRQLANIFTTPPTGGEFISLGQVGISMQATGNLLLDGSKLIGAVTSKFEALTEAIASPTGFVTRLENWAKSALEPTGLISVRTKNLDKYVKDYNSQIESMERQMKALERRYTKDFSNLNAILESMNMSSTYLSLQMSSINPKK